MCINYVILKGMNALKDLIVYDKKITSNIKKKYWLIYNNVRPNRARYA